MKAGCGDWRCTNRNCTANVGSDENGTVILKDLQHNHDASKNLHRERISNSVKQKTMDDLTDRCQKVIRIQVSSAFSESSQKIEIHSCPKLSLHAINSRISRKL